MTRSSPGLEEAAHPGAAFDVAGLARPGTQPVAADTVGADSPEAVKAGGTGPSLCCDAGPERPAHALAGAVAGRVGASRHERAQPLRAEEIAGLALPTTCSVAAEAVLAVPAEAVRRDGADSAREHHATPGPVADRPRSAVAGGIGPSRDGETQPAAAGQVAAPAATRTFISTTDAVGARARQALGVRNAHVSEGPGAPARTVAGGVARALAVRVGAVPDGHADPPRPSQRAGVAAFGARACTAEAVFAEARHALRVHDAALAARRSAAPFAVADRRSGAVLLRIIAGCARGALSLRARLGAAVAGAAPSAAADAVRAPAAKAVTALGTGRSTDGGALAPMPTHRGAGALVVRVLTLR